MKRHIIFAVIVIICVGVFSTVSIADEAKIQVFEPDYRVEANGTTLNGNTKYPILESEGITYISMQDWADLLDATVNDDGIDMRTDRSERALYYGDVLFDDKESAVAIGKAIAMENFSDRITDKTIYHVRKKGLTGRFTFYSIYVFFDGDIAIGEDLSGTDFAEYNADIEIRYFARSGEISILENRGDGDWKFI